MRNNSLKNIVAIVAGSSRGAGKGAAIALGELGAIVYVTGRSTDKKYTFPEIPSSIEDTANEIRERGGVGIPVKCDFTIDRQVKKLFEKVKNEQGKIDLLVNSAWGGEEVQINNEPFWKLPPEKWKIPLWKSYLEHWEKMFNRGVRNYLAASCYAASIMSEEQKGLIINVSYWDNDKFMGEFFFDLASTAINRLTFGLAMELRDKDIAVVALSPGFMKTEVVMKSIELNRKAVGETFGMPTQTTFYVGRAAAALINDKNILEKSGKVLKVSDLAKEYGFTDVDGTQP